MSSMLEQAILDAKELKEAAIRNAQQALIEKYSGEFENEIEKLLEQVDPAAPAVTAPVDPALTAGAPVAGVPAMPGMATAGLPPVDPEKAKADADNKSSIFDKLNFAFKDGEVIEDKVYPTGVVEIDLDSLSEFSFSKNKETPEQMALQELKALTKKRKKINERKEELEDDSDDEGSSGSFPYDSDDSDEDDFDEDNLEFEDEDEFEEDEDFDDLDDDGDIDDDELDDDEDFEDDEEFSDDDVDGDDDLGDLSDEDDFELDIEDEEFGDDEEFSMDFDTDEEDLEFEDDESEDDEFEDDELEESEQTNDGVKLSKKEILKLRNVADRIASVIEKTDGPVKSRLQSSYRELLDIAGSEKPDGPVAKKGKKEKMEEAIKLDWERSGPRSPQNGMFRAEAEHDYELEQLQAQIEELEQDTEFLKESNKKLKSGLKESINMLQNSQDENKNLNKRIKDFKQNLNESRLMNYRLLYTNKALTDASLNERQKNRIAESISEAKTAEEVKLLYETLYSTMREGNTRSTPKSLSEAVERRSSNLLLRGTQAEPKKQDEYSERMKRLAGLK